MKKKTKGFGSYLIFLAILFLLMFGLDSVKGQGEAYTQAQYEADLQEETIRKIIITPNKEAPTGYATVIFDNDTKQIYATDITQLEELARDNGYDPEVRDIPRESWFLNNVLPIIMLAGLGMFFFMMMNARNAGGGGNAKMMDFISQFPLEELQKLSNLGLAMVQQESQKQAD